jgi:hypothetical protein
MRHRDAKEAMLKIVAIYQQMGEAGGRTREIKLTRHQALSSMDDVAKMVEDWEASQE